jgi:carboxymethylenebutenolidase
MTSRRRAFLRWLAVIGTAPLVRAWTPPLSAQVSIPHEFDTSLDSMAVSFRNGNVMAMGYLSQPKMDGTYPGVILVHDESGLTAQAQGTARHVATSGYVTLAPDFLSPVGGTASLRGIDEEVKRAVSSLPLDSATTVGGQAVAHLAAMKRVVKNRIGTVGFGWGGGTALACAIAHPNLAACVVFNPALKQPMSSLEKLKAPLLAIYAGDDSAAVAGISAFETALKEHRGAHVIKVFPGVQRGFHDPAFGKVYNAAAAKEAWSMVVQHLDANLKGNGGIDRGTV